MFHNFTSADGANPANNPVTFDANGNLSLRPTVVACRRIMVRVVLEIVLVSGPRVWPFSVLHELNLAYATCSDIDVRLTSLLNPYEIKALTLKTPGAGVNERYRDFSPVTSSPKISVRIFSARCPISMMRNSLIAFSMVIVTTLGVRCVKTPLACQASRTQSEGAGTAGGTRGVFNGPRPRVPSERLLSLSVWDHISDNGERESVDLKISQVDSRADAETSLEPFREGKVATGWKVERFRIGDEGFLSTSKDGGRFEISFRKGTVVKVSSDSFRAAERFAQHVASEIEAA